MNGTRLKRPKRSRFACFFCVPFQRSKIQCNGTHNFKSQFPHPHLCLFFSFFYFIGSHAPAPSLHGVSVAVPHSIQYSLLHCLASIFYGAGAHNIIASIHLSIAGIFFLLTAQVIFSLA